MNSNTTPSPGTDQSPGADLPSGNNPSQDNDALIARTKAALDDDASQLDYRSQLKLQQARAGALAALSTSAQSRQHRTGWQWQPRLLWLAAAPAALAVVLAVPLLIQPASDSDALIASNENLQSFDDLALLADDADLDTLAEIEFYQWLADNPDASDA